jgi:hypothetical protein
VPVVEVIRELASSAYTIGTPRICVIVTKLIANQPHERAATTQQRNQLESTNPNRFVKGKQPYSATISRNFATSPLMPPSVSSL